MNKISAIFLLLFAVAVNAQQKVIPLYDGPAPGSENWTWTQQENSNNMYHSNAVYNITKPTLTIYLPDSGVTPTGTALVVCPGGGFHSLSIMQEGYAVVKWCQKKGITAFLLRYRLRHTLGDDPYKQEIADRTDKSAAQVMDTVRTMAVADGRKAIAYVREHAGEYGISPDKIGIIGFSAGGWIAAMAGVDYTPANKPDFVAPIYGPFPPALKNKIPQDAPPMFIAAAENDTYGLENDAIKLYNAWYGSKHIADLHIYSKGSHGFGMNKQGFESDMWADNFYGFLTTEGFLVPVSHGK
jgi:dienelactone hydrolase